MDRTMEYTWKGLEPEVVATVIGRARGRCQYRTGKHQCQAVMVYNAADTNELVDEQACARIYGPGLPGERGPHGSWWAMFATEHGDWLTRTESNLLLMCPKHYEEVVVHSPEKYSGQQLEIWREMALFEEQHQAEQEPGSEEQPLLRPLVFAAEYMQDHYDSCNNAGCPCVRLAGRRPSAREFAKIYAGDGNDPAGVRVAWSVSALAS